MTKHIPNLLITVAHCILIFVAFQPYITFILTLSLLCYVTNVRNSITLYMFDHVKNVSIIMFYLIIVAMLYMANVSSESSYDEEVYFNTQQELYYED